MSEPYGNICGVLVHAMPDRVEAVRSALTAIAGLEVHEMLEDGRIVVTLEDRPGSPAIDQLAEIHRTSGVVAAALVYHHFEPGSSPAAAE